MLADVPEWLAVSADLAVALGTLLLAGFTFSLARQTRTLARDTSQEVRSASRPVLLNSSDQIASMVDANVLAGLKRRSPSGQEDADGSSDWQRDSRQRGGHRGRRLARALGGARHIALAAPGVVFASVRAIAADPPDPARLSVSIRLVIALGPSVAATADAVRALIDRRAQRLTGGRIARIDIVVDDIADAR